MRVPWVVPTLNTIGPNLIVAACMRMKADYLVTNDEKLLRHAPVAAVTPAKMVQLLNVMP